MTSLQISYHAMNETKRHNQATELLTSQYNEEVRRHNLEMESQGTRSLDQSYVLTSRAQAETHRANVAQEGIASLNALTNQMAMQEQARHNMESERANLISVQNRYEVDMHRAGTAASDVRNRYTLGELQLQENRRHNKEVEAQGRQGLENQKRGQNMQLGGDIFKGLTSLGGLLTKGAK